jgi:hypothetical protein
MDVYLRKDRLLHFFFGFFIFMMLNLIMLNIEALIVTVFIAAGKEVYDLKIKETYFDLVDMLFTVLPGFFITILI